MNYIAPKVRPTSLMGCAGFKNSVTLSANQLISSTKCRLGQDDSSLYRTDYLLNERSYHIHFVTFMNKLFEEEIAIF